MNAKISIILTAIIFISFASAITCSPSTISTSFTQGTPTSLLTYCSNPSSSPVSVSQSGSDFNLDTSLISANTGNISIRVTFNENAGTGSHSGQINFNDSSTPIPILFVISANQTNQTQTPSPILIFPTSKIITVQQGDSKTQNIQITVPQSYPRTIIIQSVDLNPNVQPISFGDLNLGQISPGQSVNIPVIFSGVGASTGTYQTSMTIFATDLNGQVQMTPVSLTLQITAGINPISNFSLSDLPTCSLGANELNLNTTYSLTCSRPNPNIDIAPIIDTFYLQGIGVTETPSQYIYTFKALKIGNTIFKTHFLYKNAPVGNEFNQTLRITNSGNSPVAGTTTKFSLYQDGNLKDTSSLHSGDLIIQLKDNGTGNLINDYTLYMGGVPINNSLILEAGKNYEVTATSPGYLDNTLAFNVTSLPITITINPNQNSYFLGQTVDITTNVNATLYLDGIKVSSPYLFTVIGTKILTASASGYENTSMNITVANPVTAEIISPEVKSWGKGKDVTMKLSSSGVWNVTFEKTNGNTYNSPVNLATGVGDNPQFTLTDYGKYNVYLDNNLVGSYVFNKNNWFSSHWLLIAVILIALVLLFLIFRKKEEPSGEQVLGYGS